MASRKVYLVDTENVGTAWKEILPQKSSKDVIILFYTEHSPGISYTDLNVIREYPLSFDMILCYPVKFWSGREIEVCRKSKSELTAPQKRETEDEDVRDMLKQALPETYRTEEYLEKIYVMLCNYDVKQLQKLYFALQKEMGAEAGMEIYRCLKPQIKNIYKKIPK